MAMKIISFINLFQFVIFILIGCKSKNASSIESIQLNSDNFNVDTAYSNVLIGEKLYTITVLEDKIDEKLEGYESSESDYDSPKTIVIVNGQTGEIAYVSKFESSKPFFLKQSTSLSKVGKLYFHVVQFGGGSGFSSSTSLLAIKENKIQIIKIFNSCEIDYILFNKNDKEIYVLSGIWSDGLDKNGEPIETHFARHRYKVMRYLIGSDSVEEKEIGVTKNKYSSGDDAISSTDLFQLIINGEDFMPDSIDVSDYNVFDNFSGGIFIK
jgi:hypothetical protein